MKLKFPVRARILTTSIAALVATTEAGNTAAWVGNIDGNWSDPSSWTGGVPNGIDAIADASGIDITANRTITVDGNFTVGILRFADAVTASHDWVLAPPAGNTTNALTLDVSTGRPTLDVLSRAVTVGVILAGSEGLAKTGAGTAFLTRANTYTGDTTVTAGALILGSGGSVGSLQTERVINSVVPPSAAGGGPGGFEIRRADAYTVPFAITNAGNNRSAGSLTINSGDFSTATTGVTISGLVRQQNIHVGRIGQFGRLFLETGADIDVDFYSLGEQSGRTGQGIQNGGNVVIGNRMQVGHWPQADPLTGTANTTTPSSYTMNGGTLTIVGTFTGNPHTPAAPEKAGSIYLGIDSTGELIVNGGTINTKAIVLDNRGATNGIDRLTINGGTVRVGGVGPGNDADLNNIGSAIISNNTSSTYAVSYNGGVIQASGNFLHAVAAVLENTSGGIAFDSNGNVITVTGALSGGGGLRKTGAGTLLMKGISSYTGTTIVDGGVFSLVGNISSAVEVNNGGAASGNGDGISTGVYGNILVNTGGALAPGMFGTAGSIGTLAATSVTTSGDARFDLSPTATTPGGGVNDLIAVGGPLAFNAGSTITPIFSALPTSGNTYTLFTSTARTGTPTLSLQSASRLTFAIDTTTQPNNVLLSVSGSGASLNLTWRGDGTTNSWDINSSANWNNNTEKFFQLDTVAFDDTGTNTPPINLVGLLQPVALTVAGVRDYTFGGSGTISGPGGLTKTGAGVLTIIGGGHDFSGPVNVTGGTVVISALRRAGQPSSLGAGSVLNLDGATVRYTGPSTSTDRTVTLNGTGATFELVESTALVSLNTAVAGTGKLTKTGLGTLVLPPGNSYAGGTDILRGAVHISSNERALGDGFEVRLDNGALLEMNGASGVGATRRYDIIIGPNGGTLSNAGAAVVNNPIYRSITMQGNLTIHTNSRYDLNGGDVDGTGVTINGELFSITKTGTGETWWSPNLGAAVGDIIVNGGTFGVQSNANLGSDAHSITVNPPGQLFTFSAVSNTKPVVLNGTLLAANNSTGTWLGTVTLNGAGTSNRIGIVTNGAGVTIGGQLTGPGGFERVNGGTVELQNPTNNWFGETLLSAGMLVVSTPGAFSPNSALNIAGGTLDLALTEQTAAGLRGSVGIIQGGGALTVNQTQDATFNGTITDTVALTKAGPATLILTATNPTTGTATVTAGTLMVNGSVAGNVAIDGGTLAGNGTVGPVALNALGTLAPGDGRGILDSGNTTFNGGTFALEIAGPALDAEYDQLKVTGTFNLAANTTLALTLGYDPADFSHTFTIISNDGVDPLTRAGLFSYNGQLLIEGAIFSVGTQPFQITYAGGSDSNDVVLSAIPEPGGCATLLAGLSSLLGLQRPRRRAR